MKKTLLIAILMVISVLAVKSQTAIAPLGDGTTEIPYQISTWENLYWVSQNTTSWDKHYVQTADITFPADVNTWDGGQGLTPIGNSGTNFTGSYDGQNFEIHNLHINRPNSIYVGLFGIAGSNPLSSLKNIHIQSPEITGRVYTAGLVSEFSDGDIIYNCHVIDAQITSESTAGGIVSQLKDTISTCSFSGEITVTDGYNAGGIVGSTIWQTNSYMENCYNTGNVNVSIDHAGGLAGTFQGEIINSYNVGHISGRAEIGGVVGDFHSGSISNCYSGGSVSASSAPKGFVGTSGGEITNSFWDINADGIPNTFHGTDNKGATGLASLSMTSINTFQSAGWDFGNVWDIMEGNKVSYPYLQSIPQDPPPGYQDPVFAGGDGSPENPYQIASLASLKYLSLTPEELNDQNFILTADIDASDTQNWSDEWGDGFKPIGLKSPYFQGTFDGNGHKITGIYINRPLRLRVGLFGYTNEGAIIKNLHIEGNITGKSETGTLIGYALGTTIENCKAVANVTAEQYAGGLIGRMKNSTVKKSEATGVVNSTQSGAGGLIGFVEQNADITIIEQSWADADVSSSMGWGGGFIGSVSKPYLTSSIHIKNCFSLGDVTHTGTSTSTSVAAFIGNVASFNTITIENSYATGNVFYTNGNDPVNSGFCGGSSQVNYNGNFFDIESSNQSSSQSTATGLNEAEMQNACNFLAAGWDFAGETTNGADDIWKMTDDPAFNGYPVLNWMEAGNPVALPDFCAQAPLAGDGTESDPYQIGSLNTLYWVSQNHAEWGKHFILTADIDATDTQNWNGGEGWDPIGDWHGVSNGVNPFTGVFDGNGFKISNIYINRPEKFMMGFFGFTQSGAEIKNLFIEEINITGATQIGGLIGRADDTTIENCHVTGSVTGTSSTGGLVGALREISTIKRSSSAGTVTGTDKAGGLVGQTGTAASVIEESFSHAMVYSDSYDVGGFTGYNGSAGVIRNCFSTGDVTRTGGTHDGYGPFAGFVSPGGVVEKSYSTGSVFFENGDDPIDNGFVAYGYATFDGNFFDMESSNQTSSHEYGDFAATGLNISEMQDACNFLAAGWDFAGESNNGTDDIWAMKDDPAYNGYPVLNWMEAGNIVALPDFCAQAPLAGDGTESDPYQIGSLEMLMWISQNPDQWDKYYTLTDDVDATVTNEWNDGEGWQPIGNTTTQFTGVFDGNGHTISNLFINRPLADYQGFFGYLSNATVMNLHFNGANYTGNEYVGTLTANAENSTIQSCSSHQHTITGDYYYIGGLIGSVSGIQVDDCEASGSVSGYKSVGGLIGYSENITLSRCYAGGTVVAEIWQTGGLIGGDTESTINTSWSDADVTAETYVGGFIGYTYGSTIQNCYAMGPVTGTLGEGIGGFMGEEDNVSTIVNCFSAGLVTGSDDQKTGGFNGDGWDAENGSITGSFWDVDATGQGQSMQATGLSSAEMMKFKTFYEASWDFKGEDNNGTDYLWNIGNGRNGGYPYFNWQYPDDKAPQLIYADPLTNKVYGDPAFTFTATNTSALPVIAESNNLSVAVVSDNEITITGAGEATITLAHDGNADYNAAEQVQLTFTVTKADLAVTAADAAKVYGEIDPVFDVIYNDFVYNDDASSLSGTLDFDRTAGEDVGFYTIAPSGLMSDNYNITFTEGELEITPADLTVTADSGTKVYGENDPVWGATYVGFVWDDTEADLSGTLVVDRDAGEDVGLYAVTASGVSSTNYTLGFVAGELEITPADLTVTADSGTKVYGEDDPVWGVTYDGFVWDDTEADLSGTLVVDRDAGEDVGTYAVNASGVTSTNYTLGFVAGELEITPADLTVTANNISKIYGEEVVLAGDEYQVSGLVEGDAVSAVTLTSDGAAATATVGEYAVVASDAQGTGITNYNIDYVAGMLTVDKKTLVISGDFEVADKVYDGTTDAVIETDNLTLETVLFEDDVMLTGVVAEFESADPGVDIQVNIVAAEITGAATGNYELSMVDAPIATASITESTNVSELTDLDINVYPNPASNFVNVASSEVIYTISVIDLTGKTVIEKQNIGAFDITINVSDLLTGIYILQIETESGVYLKKVQVK